MIVGGVAAIGLRTRAFDDTTVVSSSVTLNVLLLPLLTAMGLVATERQERTLPVFSGMPISPTAILAVKTAVGAAVVTTPLAAAWILTAVVAGGRELALQQQTSLFLGAAWVSLVTLVWMVAVSAGQPTEPRAGLVCVALLAVWILIASALGVRRGSLSDAVLYLVPLRDHELLNPYGHHLQPVWFVLAVQAFGCAIVWGLAGWRLGRAGGARP